MRRGNIGFVGQRLEEARLARGLSQTNLAQLVGRNSSTVSAWESSRQLPDSETVTKLATVLGVRRGLFFRDDSLAERPHFYRSNASITVGLQKKSKARLRWAELMVSEMEEWVDFLPVSFPSLRIDDLLAVTDAEIDTAANNCRSHWGLGSGPVSDVIMVLENAGAIIVRDELGGQKMDGVSAWSAASGRPFVLLATDKASAVRSRFDAAHELGHLVMHRGIDPEFLSKSEYAELERQAHRFASAFLMPAESFLKSIRHLDLESFVDLKSDWKVSIGAMIMRCAQLDVISEEYKSRMFKYMSQRGWRREEPLDRNLEPERPTAMASAIMLLIDAEKYSREELLDLFGLNAGDVEAISSLPAGYLQREAAPVVRLRDYR